MTVPEILIEVKRKGKKMSKATLYTHLKVLGIQPKGARQIPQNYPEDTPHRIALHLGLETNGRKLRRAA